VTTPISTALPANFSLLPVGLRRIKYFALANRQRVCGGVEFLKEATFVARMAGAGRLLDFEKKDIFIAIHKPPDDALRVAAGLAFEPELASRAAPVGHQPRIEGFFERLVIHPREHEHAPGWPGRPGGFLNDDGNEAVLSKFEIEFHGIASDRNLSIIENCR